jgi:hypothetical protein
MGKAPMLPSCRLIIAALIIVPAVALGIIVLVGLRRWGKAATNAGNYTPAGTAPRSSGVGREQQARLE